MRWARRWIAVALVIAALVGVWALAHENQAPVHMSYLWGSVELPLWQALLCFFAGGFAVAGTGWLWHGVRARLIERRYRKAVGGLEAEIHQLRNLPLVPEREGGR
jgi:uncharacterized integral membrane protein